MANKIDVLAVMDGVPDIVQAATDDLLITRSTPGGKPHDPDPAIAEGLAQLAQARATVAELIEAVAEQLEALDAPQQKFGSDALALQRADNRVRAALVRVKGG